MIHNRNFLNFYLYFIYFTFYFTLKSMGRAHLIMISLKEITIIIFSYKSLVRKLHVLFSSKYQMKLITYRLNFKKIKFFLFLQGTNDSSVKYGNRLKNYIPTIFEKVCQFSCRMPVVSSQIHFMMHLRSLFTNEN
jgi:hypothetical protein